MHHLTVLICTHNRATLLAIWPDCANRPQRAVEILVVANACTDGTHALLEAYAHFPGDRLPATLDYRTHARQVSCEVVASFDDPRIRYVRNEPNLKLPRALNRGFSLARGEYLTCTSDDNLYGENAIQRMVGVLQGGNCDFIYSALERSGSPQGIVQAYNPAPEDAHRVSAAAPEEPRRSDSGRLSIEAHRLWGRQGCAMQLNEGAGNDCVHPAEN